MKEEKWDILETALKVFAAVVGLTLWLMAMGDIVGVTCFNRSSVFDDPFECDR